MRAPWIFAILYVTASVVNAADHANAKADLSVLGAGAKGSVQGAVKPRWSTPLRIGSWPPRPR